jgi:hypothetical protein
MVVLPAPLGPSRDTTVPASTSQVDVVDGDEVAEALGESVGDDGQLGWGHAALL